MNKTDKFLHILDIVVLPIGRWIAKKIKDKKAREKECAKQKQLAEEQAQIDAEAARAAGKRVEEQLRSADKAQELNHRP